MVSASVNEHEHGQTPGDGEGQGNLVYFAYRVEIQIDMAILIGNKKLRSGTKRLLPVS